MERVRAALIEARKAAGMTQDELAGKLGIGRRQLIRIERGESDGSLGLWIRVKAALDLNSEQLMRCMMTESMQHNIKGGIL